MVVLFLVLCLIPVRLLKYSCWIDPERLHTRKDPAEEKSRGKQADCGASELVMRQLFRMRFVKQKMY